MSKFCTKVAVLVVVVLLLINFNTAYKLHKLEDMVMSGMISQDGDIQKCAFDITDIKSVINQQDIKIGDLNFDVKDIKQGYIKWNEAWATFYDPSQLHYLKTHKGGTK